MSLQRRNGNEQCLSTSDERLQPYEVDAEKLVTKILFIDKRATIMDYTRLLGDIPDSKRPASPQTFQLKVDLSKLTNEEWEAVKRGRLLIQRLINEAKEVAQPSTLLKTN